jgi:hypothetical protein
VRQFAIVFSSNEDEATLRSANCHSVNEVLEVLYGPASRGFTGADPECYDLATKANLLRENCSLCFVLRRNLHPWFHIRSVKPKML